MKNEIKKKKTKAVVDKPSMPKYVYVKYGENYIKTEDKALVRELKKLGCKPEITVNGWYHVYNKEVLTKLK